MSNCKINDPQAILLARRLMYVTALNLSNNFIGNAGVEALAKNNIFEILILNKNFFQKNCLNAFSKNSTLIALDLSCNNLVNEDIEKLKLPPTLTTLDLSANFIESIVEFINRHPMLTNLNLHNNRIPENEIKALAHNHTLKKLNLGLNAYDVKAFCHNQTLTDLTVDDEQLNPVPLRLAFHGTLTTHCQFNIFSKLNSKNNYLLNGIDVDKERLKLTRR
jgi:hypothetical protein